MDRVPRRRLHPGPLPSPARDGKLLPQKRGRRPPGADESRSNVKSGPNASPHKLNDIFVAYDDRLAPVDHGADR
jgi:hypothetical protein